MPFGMLERSQKSQQETNKNVELNGAVFTGMTRANVVLANADIVRDYRGNTRDAFAT